MFNGKIIRQFAVAQSLAVVGNECGVVFAYTPVFVDFGFIKRDVAEHNAKVIIRRGVYNILPAGFAVFNESGLFPQVAD